MGIENKEIKSIISTEVELRKILGEPSERALKKVISSLDHHCVDFLSKSPFLVLSTANKLGECDASPRGDAPGFVFVFNNNKIIIPERPGNRRIDSILNIISNPRVGLIFLSQDLGDTQDKWQSVYNKRRRNFARNAGKWTQSVTWNCG